MKNITKWILFISSYIPLFIILIVNNIDLNRTFESISHIFCGNLNILINNITFKDIYLLILILTCIFFPLLISFILKSSDGFHQPLVVKSIETNNSSVLEYFITYLVTLISSGFSLREIIVFWIILYIIGHIYIKNNMLYVNPTLYLLFKFNIYKVSDSDGLNCFVLSKLNEYEFNSIVNKKISVIPISESFNGNIYIYKK